MTWYAVAGAAVVAVGSAVSQSQAANAASKSASKASIAENDAIAKRNMSQMVRNHYRAGMLSMQLGLDKKKALQETYETSKNYTAAMGQVQANVGAAGAMGASVDAVAQDVNQRQGEARAVQEDNYEMMLVNFNSELEALRMNALNEVVESRKYEYTGPSQGEIWGGALLGAAVQVAGNYALRQANLGLGERTGTMNVGSTTGTMAGFRTDPFGPSTNRFGGW